MKNTIKLLLVMLTISLSSYGQEKVKLMLDIKDLLASNSPISIANDLKKAGIRINSDKNIIDELTLLKNKFSNKAFFYGTGYRTNFKHNKFHKKATSVLAEANALINLSSNTSSTLQQLRDSINARAILSFCYNDVTKLEFIDDQNNILVLLMILKEDIVNRNTCNVKFEMVNDVYSGKNENEVNVFTSESYIRISDNNKEVRSIYLKMKQEGDIPTIILKEETSQGILEYQKINSQEKVEFTPNKK